MLIEDNIKTDLAKVRLTKEPSYEVCGHDYTSVFIKLTKFTEFLRKTLSHAVSDHIRLLSPRAVFSSVTQITHPVTVTNHSHTLKLVTHKFTQSRSHSCIQSHSHR
jgi:hypothetical protein